MLVDRPGLAAWVASLGIVVAYVGSLYVWPARHRAPRDAPGVIKRRFLSLAGACALACLPLHRALLASDVSPRPPSLARALGVHPDPVAALASVAASLGLAAALFLGPLVALALDGRLLPRFADALRLDHLVKWRNYVVAPATEEFAFRACVAPLLLVSGAATLRAAVFASPLLFGLAHVHHFAELRRRTGSASAAALGVAAQFTYTVVFGWFAAFAFLRTGHVAGPIAAHAFCNVMGLPDVSRAATHPKTPVIAAAYVLGIAVFIGGLWPATDPAMHPASTWDAFAAASASLVAKRHQTAR
jgi:prenyl protein peptidase